MVPLSESEVEHDLSRTPWCRLQAKARIDQMSDKPIERCEFESQKLLVRLHFTIRADVKAISPVVEGVVKIVQEMECAEGKEFEIETALREAFANAIKHGCQNDCSR
jgi:hypothetical protein